MVSHLVQTKANNIKLSERHHSVMKKSSCLQARRLGGVLWVRTNPPTEAIEFHLAWLKQGSKVCKDNKPYAAICFK